MTFELTLSDRNHQSFRPADDTGSADPASSKVILLLEDETALRDVVRWVLEDEGFSVQWAQDGHDALAVVIERTPSLVILDVTLPGMSAGDTANGLRELLGNDLPILLTSGDSETVDMVPTIGAYGFLPKPFELDDLISEVRRGLRIASQR